MAKQHIETLVDNAFSIAVDHQHEYVTLEHMMMALLEDDSIVALMVDLEAEPGEIYEALHHYVSVELEDIVVTVDYTKPRKITDPILSGCYNSTP